VTRSIHPLIIAAPADPHRPIAAIDEEAELFVRLGETGCPAELDAIWHRIFELADARLEERPTYVRSPLSAGKFSTNASPKASTSTVHRAPPHNGFRHPGAVVERGAPIVIESSPAPMIARSKTDMETVRKVLAVARAKYQSSPREQARRKTLRDNRDEAARQADVRAAGDFEDLTWHEQINNGRDYFQAGGRVWSGTLLLDMHTIALVRSWPANERLSRLTSRVRRALRKALGRHPAFIATMQINAAGFEHLHVIIELALEEVDVAEKALTTKGCLGKWKVRPAWKRRGEQIDLDPLCDDGWTRYITRHEKNLARGDFYMNREFRDAAVQHHEAKRQEATARRDSAKPQEAQHAPCESLPSSRNEKHASGLRCESSAVPRDDAAAAENKSAIGSAIPDPPVYIAWQPRCCGPDPPPG
jgi:hypothetical protein